MLYTPTYSCYLGLQQCETDLWGFVDLEVLRCCFGVGWVFFFFYTFCSQLCCHQLNYYFSLAFKILTLPFVTPYAYQNAGNLQIKRYKLSRSCLL